MNPIKTMLMGASVLALSSASLTAHAQTFEIQSATATGTHASYPASNVFDGDERYASRWSGSASPEELVVDLGRDQRVDDVRVAWGRGNNRSYTFEIAGRSGTSGSWTTIFEGESSGDTSRFENFNVNDFTAQQIRIRGLSNSRNADFTHIAEVQVIGTGGPSETVTPRPAEAAGLDIVYTASSDRSNTQQLEGSSVSGGIFVLLDREDEANIDQVRYFVDDVFIKTENGAPYDLQGGVSHANVFDTSGLGIGSHILRTDIRFVDGTKTSFNTEFNVDNDTPTPTVDPTSGLNIVYTASSDRSNTQIFEGSTVSGEIFVLLDRSDEANIDQVRYFIDDVFIKTENGAPFDLQGGVSHANGFNVDGLDDGPHILRADIRFNDGSRGSFNTQFNVGDAPETPVESSFGLDPNAEPWENFDLDGWAYDSPVERPDNNCRSIRSDEDEWDEFRDSPSNPHFFTHTDGGMRFVSPAGGATTSTNCNSGFPRSELREMLRRGNTSVSTTGVNANNWALGYQPNGGDYGGRNGVLSASLRVNKVTTTGDGLHPGRTIIGQIHAENDEPARLYYRKPPNADRGCVYLEHEIRDGNDVTFNLIGDEKCTDNGPADGIALDELFSYEIINDNEKVIVRLRRGDKDAPVIAQATVDMNELNSGYDRSDEWMYFKAGVYTQNNTGDDDDADIITFYHLETSHDSN